MNIFCVCASLSVCMLFYQYGAGFLRARKCERVNARARLCVGRGKRGKDVVVQC